MIWPVASVRAKSWRRAASVCSVSVLLAANLALQVSAQSQSSHATDEADIRSQAQEYSRDFAAGAADKLTALWSDDALFVDQNGEVYRGRKAINDQYVDFFKQFGGQPLDVRVESITFPTDNMAVEEGISCLRNESSPASTSRYVVTHVKRDGKWFMQTVTESPYRAVKLGEYLKPLEWMVGSWQIEGPNGVLKLKAAWANDNVMTLDVDSKVNGGTQKNVNTEFIYWNPAAASICSWQYDSLGGTSQKRWERSGDSWIIHAHSMQADGSEGAAVYKITKINNDTFSWQSKLRRLGDIQLPDTQELKVNRVKS